MVAKIVDDQGNVVPSEKKLPPYDPHKGQELCELVAQGQSLRTLCGKKNMPSWYEVWAWRVQSSEFATKVDQALEMSGHAMFYEALELAREIQENPQNSSKVRATEVLLSHLRWASAKMAPKSYSERGAKEITVPIQINTSIDLGQEDGGSVRPPDRDEVYRLDAKIELAPEPEPTMAENRAPGKPPRTRRKKTKVGSRSE